MAKLASGSFMLAHAAAILAYRLFALLALYAPGNQLAHRRVWRHAQWRCPIWPRLNNVYSGCRGMAVWRAKIGRALGSAREMASAGDQRLGNRDNSCVASVAGAVARNIGGEGCCDCMPAARLAGIDRREKCASWPLHQCAFWRQLKARPSYWRRRGGIGYWRAGARAGQPDAASSGHAHESAHRGNIRRSGSISLHGY